MTQKIWLEYARNQDGNLVHVEDSRRGLSGGLLCPFCGAEVMARQGAEKSWHFAHRAEESCAPARKMSKIVIPLYDDFFLGLKPRRLAELIEFASTGRMADSRMQRRMEAADLIAWNPYARNGRGVWELTKRGKIPLGALSVPLFAAIQDTELRRFLDCLPADGVDAEIVREHWARLQRSSLYFLKVEIPGLQLLHKIGMTGRAVEERVAEIRADLSDDYGPASVSVLGCWPGLGRLERYCKFRLRRSWHPLGARTEYFHFADVKPVLRELRRL